jgi:hypothetical protein
MVQEDFMQIYNGIGANADRIELCALSGDDVKQQVRQSGQYSLELHTLYEELDTD